MISLVGIGVIYILSRAVLRHVYLLLRRFTHSHSLIIGFISLLYFPGTVVHEMSHYIAALVLNLHPREVRLFPQILDRRVRLGHVLYEVPPGDIIRPFLVGIAPIFGACCTLWLMAHAYGWYEGNMWIVSVIAYLILSITANMFSSPQDLKHAASLIPILIIVSLISYILPIELRTTLIRSSSYYITAFFSTIQPLILFSAFAHAILVILFILINRRL